MLLSFLASLTRGVALQEDTVDFKEEVGSVKAGLIAKIAGKLHALFSAEASAQLEASSSERATGELRATRHYTHAALLNDLRDLLAEQIKMIHDPEQVSDDLRGCFVEVTGTITGNPLEQLLRFYERVVPYVEEPTPSVDARVRAWWDARSGKKAKPPPRYLTQRVVRRAVRRKDPRDLNSLSIIRSELDGAQVRDLLLEAAPISTMTPTDNGGKRPAKPVRVVLTLSRQYLTPVSEDQLTGGRFTVLGKVTSIVPEGGEPINLARRATIGLIGQDAVKALLTAYPVPHQEGFDPLVSAPAIQVMPIAIFI